MAGEKSFTSEQAQKLGKYLGLFGLEAEYLLFMVQLERAGSDELRKFWSGKLDELKDRALILSNRLRPKRVLNDQERSIFYSTALYSAIRLYTSVGDKGKSLIEIAERFEIPRTKAAEILKFLVEIGLCAQRGDRYFMGVQSTHLEQGSPHMLKHHSNWRIRAIRQSEELSETELMYTANVSLSKKDFEKLREKMVGFLKDFLTVVHDSPAEEIACLNLDFFWIKK